MGPRWFFSILNIQISLPLDPGYLPKLLLYFCFLLQQSSRINVKIYHISFLCFLTTYFQRLPNLVSVPSHFCHWISCLKIVYEQVAQSSALFLVLISFESHLLLLRIPFFWLMMLDSQVYIVFIWLNALPLVKP